MLGEPILLQLEATNVGSAPLMFDHRPGRYTWVVRDEDRTVLCDVGGRSPRLGSSFVAKTTLPPGETFRETSLVNPVCRSFTRPGRYRVSVMRVISNDARIAPPRACDDLVPPERTDSDASAPGPSTERDAGCDDVLGRFPAIAAELSIELTPWDAGALRTRLATLNEERTAAHRAHDLSREGALSTYGEWFCKSVRCDCAPTWKRQGEWFAKALSRVPETVPGTCRRR